MAKSGTTSAGGSKARSKKRTSAKKKANAKQRTSAKKATNKKKGAGAKGSSAKKTSAAKKETSARKKTTAKKKSTNKRSSKATGAEKKTGKRTASTKKTTSDKKTTAKKKTAARKKTTAKKKTTTKKKSTAKKKGAGKKKSAAKKSDTPAAPKQDFDVGAKIVHPAHGAGVIVAIEQHDVVDEFSRYYIIELAAQEMRLMVPLRTAEDIGLRPVASKTRATKVMRRLKADAEPLPEDFKKRQSYLTGRLREGDAESLADVVRDMAYRSLEKTYSPTEARLFEQAKTMLAGELALAQGIEVDTALERIDGATASRDGKAEEA